MLLVPGPGDRIYCAICVIVLGNGPCLPGRPPGCFCPRQPSKLIHRCAAARVGLLCRRLDNRGVSVGAAHQNGHGCVRGLLRSLSWFVCVYAKVRGKGRDERSGKLTSCAGRDKHLSGSCFCMSPMAFLVSSCSAEFRSARSVVLNPARFTASRRAFIG